MNEIVKHTTELKMLNTILTKETLILLVCLPVIPQTPDATVPELYFLLSFLLS